MKLNKLFAYFFGALVVHTLSTLPAHARTLEEELLQTKFRTATPYSFTIAQVPGRLDLTLHSRSLPYEADLLGKRKSDELNVVFLAMKLLKVQNRVYSFDQDPIEDDRPLSSFLNEP